MKRIDPAPGSKKQTPETDPRPPEESGSLPEKYGETGVVLLPVTPDRVFAFWEIAGPQGAPRSDGTTLRLHESGGPPEGGEPQETTREIAVERQAGSRYMHLRQAGSCCQAEIGYHGSDGGFIQAASSHTVETPRPLPAPREMADRRLQAAAARQTAPPPLERQGAAPPPSPPAEGRPPVVPEMEEQLAARRLDIFRHLQEEASPATAGHPAAAGSKEEAGRPLLQDLTESNERKFVAGISSR